MLVAPEHRNLAWGNSVTEWLWLVQFSVVRESSRVQMMVTVSVGIASCIVAVCTKKPRGVR